MMEEEEDLCPFSFTPDTFFLTDETLAKFPYALDEPVNSLFYSDSVGNRVLASFPHPPSSFAGGIYPNTVPCIHDTTQEIRIIGKYERVGTEIHIDELGIIFSLGYHVRHNLERYGERIFKEYGGVYVTSLLDADDPYFLRPIPQLSYTINNNNWLTVVSDPILPADEVVLNGKTYFDVYTSNVGVDKFLIYYNYQLGLVGFEDRRDGVLYTLAD